MPSKQYLLQLARTLNLIAALTTALLAIYPLLSGRPDWPQIIALLAITFFAAIGHSAIGHINDKALRDALDSTLSAVQRLLQQSGGTWQPSPQYDAKTTKAVDPQTTQYGMPRPDMPPRG